MFTVPKSRKGMSLVEVLVAISILLITMIASSFVFVSGKSQIKRQGDYRIAAQLAAQKLEELKAGSYSAIADGETTESLSSQDLSHCSRSTGITTEGGGLYKKVGVTVRWGRTGDEHNVSFVTFIAPK